LLTEQNKKDVIFGNSLKNILEEFLKACRFIVDIASKKNEHK